jgi:hypothetical protein
MHTVFSNPEMWKSHQEAMPPRELLDVFIWFYLFMGVLLIIGLALNVLSGVFMWQKRNRIFSLVIGGLNCLKIPFGTVQGIFTILVLPATACANCILRMRGRKHNEPGG